MGAFPLGARDHTHAPGPVNASYGLVFLRVDVRCAVPARGSSRMNLATVAYLPWDHDCVAPLDALPSSGIMTKQQ